MNTTIEPPPGDKAEEERLELKPFLLAAALWLPLSFFLWFILRTGVVYPVVRLVAAVTGSWMPELFTNFNQYFHEMRFDIALPVFDDAGTRVGVLELKQQLNVLPFCYGIPVLVGLSIATPISWGRTGMQLLIGLPILTVVQAFGVLGDLLKRIAFNVGALAYQELAQERGPEAAAKLSAQAQASAVAFLRDHGLTETAVALWYQFGYLILPAITPVVLWILFNRRFIEALRPLPRAG